MKYIVVNSVSGYTKKQVAKGLSKLLWDLVRPDTVKHPDDVTKYMFGILEGKNLDLGEWAIMVDELYEIKQHAQADPDSLRPLLTHLTTEEKQSLKDKFEATNRIPFGQVMSYFGEIRTEFDYGQNDDLV